MRLVPAILCLLLISCGAVSAENTQAQRLVQVVVNFQEADPFLPWQKLRPGVKRGYGVVVRENVILTTETLVRNNILVEIILPGSGRKLRARSMIADRQVNLALVSLVDEAQALPREELALCDNFKLGDKGQIIQTDDTSAIQECSAKVLQVSMEHVSDASFLTLSYTLLTEPGINFEGAPVYTENLLAGLIANIKGAREATMIPYPVIRRFLEDAKTPPYSGFTSAGFMWTQLVDPAKRKFFGLPDEEVGIQIIATIPGTGAAETLKPNDVVVAIDATPVDSLGFYKDADYGRLLFPYIISGRHSAGESITVSIIRDGKQMEVKVPLYAWNDNSALIPEDHDGAMSDYVADGGLVIRELSGRYLRAHGGDWEARVGSRLAYYYATRKNASEKKGDRILVLSGVLPDTINMGYQNIRNEIVTHVNGSEVRSMDDVYRAMDEKGGLRSVSLLSDDLDLFFDADEINAANRRIETSYRLPAINSRKLKTVNELKNR